MKSTGILLLLVIMMTSCHSAKKKNATTKDAALKVENRRAENFDWLLGQWIRLGEEKGIQTYENWSKKSATTYVGIGFTMQGVDTLSQERILLQKVKGQWNLSVKMPEDTAAVNFLMTAFTASEFTCENSDHDFPNTIKYWKTETRLNASVSNAEVEIPFEFKKRGQ